MKFRVSKVLRFWVDCEYHRIKKHVPGCPRTELIAQILREFEEAGDAMRYLNTKGEIAWKATTECFRGSLTLSKRPGTIWRIGPDASGDLARKLRFSQGVLTARNYNQLDHSSQNRRERVPYPIRRQPCARTWNGSETPGTTVRPPGTGMRSMGTSMRSTAWWLGGRRKAVKSTELAERFA
jgi:hypothetical protein